MIIFCKFVVCIILFAFNYLCSLFGVCTLLFGSCFVACRWSFPLWCLCGMLPTLLFELRTLLFVFHHNTLLKHFVFWTLLRALLFAFHILLFTFHVLLFAIYFFAIFSLNFVFWSLWFVFWTSCFGIHNLFFAFCTLLKHSTKMFCCSCSIALLHSSMYSCQIIVCFIFLFVSLCLCILLMLLVFGFLLGL